MDHATNECLSESSGLGHLPQETHSGAADLLAVFSSEFSQLKRIIAGMGLSALDGEDILQDVSIKALKQQKSGPQTAILSREDSAKWLIKVTVNRCLMEHRSRRTFRRHADEILKRRQEIQKNSKATLEKVIVAEELEIVRQSLQKLDDSLLAPMVLRYFCNLNSKEISKILTLSSSTVRSRLREARIILAKSLLQRGVEP
jgi:RNA polymerase sigma factor (sigma-70 family)